MCGEEGADETHCLDVCSGYEAELPDTDGFKYRYYMVSVEKRRGRSHTAAEVESRVCTLDIEEGKKTNAVLCPPARQAHRSRRERELPTCGSLPTILSPNERIPCGTYCGNIIVCMILSN